MSKDLKIVEKENKDNQTIGLDKVLEICEQYSNKEISQKELQDWALENIKIYLYLPIETKFLLINQILYLESFYSVDDSSLKAMELEMKKFWVIALAYTNIQTDDFKELQTINTYDLMFSIMGDWIISNCEKDYNRTIGILENTININNINGVMETFGSMDTQSLNEYTTAIENQLKYFKENKEQIRDLADIVKFNQPSLDNRLKDKKE